jgi:hypothetical protein
MRFRYDASSKWLIDHHADAILRLAGVTGVRSWRPLPPEVVQSRQLPDGLVEVRLADRPEPDLFLIEINTYPDNRVPGELLDDLLLTYLNRRRLPELVALTLRPKGNVRVAAEAERLSPLGWSGLRGAWRVVNLWERPAADVLAPGRPRAGPVGAAHAAGRAARAGAPTVQGRDRGEGGRRRPGEPPGGDRDPGRIGVR